ncbi:hypothetical protein L218DRAFT_954789 [Marasmius fiardii PR-910]|nr:hypothetical protein L218DRAFT_954789 [Marasmius fiardii PR-910]
MTEEKGIRKRRLQNACDECRRRKVRCDSATAPGKVCSNCLSLRIECTHQVQKKKRGPNGPVTNEGRALVNAILSPSKPYIPPEDPEAVKKILIRLANHARSLDRQVSELAYAIRLDYESLSATGSPAAPNNTSGPAAQSEQSEAEDSIDSLAQELKNMSVTHFYKRHFGKSSNYMLVQSVMDSRCDVLGDPTFTQEIFVKYKRPEFWNYHPWLPKLHRQEPPLIFPEEDLLCDLVNLYFTNVHPVFPVLHRPSFERSVADGLHVRDRPFGVILLVVCAIGARQSNDPRNLSEGTTSEHSLGWKWFSQVPFVHDSFAGPPSLYDLQLLSLSVIFLITNSVLDANWTLIGIGIRSAQEMGVHRKPAQSRNAVEDELFKRAFWLLVSVDLFFSAFLGRPRATTSDDFDVDLPVECDDEYWENPDPEKAFVQPAGKPSVVSFFSTLLRLLEIVSFAQRTLYSVRNSELWSGMGISGIDWKRKAVMQLDSALNKFLDTIPEHLKWNPENPDPVFFQQSVMLHVIYNWVQIHIHRPFIPRPGQEAVLTLPSLEICTNAARKIIYIVQTLQTRTDSGIPTLELAPFISSPMIQSALILLVGIWRPKPGLTTTLDSPMEMADVYRSLRLIQKYESRYAFAGRLSDILHAVIAIGQLPRTNQIRSKNDEEHGPASSRARKVLEQLHDAFHNLPPSARTPSLQNLSSLAMDDVPASSSPPGSLRPPHHVAGISDASRPLQTETDFLIQDLGLPGDIPLFGDNLSASQFMLQRQSASVTTSSMWNTPSTLWGNVNFIQEDWDSFMASVNDIVTDAVGYRSY